MRPDLDIPRIEAIATRLRSEFPELADDETLRVYRRAHELYRYDPDTGIFYYKINRLRMRAGFVAGTQNGKYRQIRIGRKICAAHRIAWLMTYGRFPSGDLDHINRDPSDNRICNLREATRTQNCANQGLRKDCISGVRGVNWQKCAGKWVARIQVNGKRINLGTFDSIEDAACAYEVASRQIFGEFSSPVRRAA